MAIAFVDSNFAESSFDSILTVPVLFSDDDRFGVGSCSWEAGTTVTAELNGVPMTVLVSPSNNNRVFVSASEPAAGTLDMVFTAVDDAASLAAGASYSGVDGYDAGSPQSSTSSTSNPSVTVPSDSGELVVGGTIAGHGGAVTATPGSGQSERVDEYNDSFASISLSDEAGASPNVTHSYALSATPSFNQLCWGVALEPAVAAGPETVVVTPLKIGIRANNLVGAETVVVTPLKLGLSVGGLIAAEIDQEVTPLGIGLSTRPVSSLVDAQVTVTVVPLKIGLVSRPITGLTGTIHQITPLKLGMVTNPVSVAVVTRIEPLKIGIRANSLPVNAEFDTSGGIKSLNRVTSITQVLG